MFLRRLPLAGALALLAGILGHGLLFGISHALGGAHEAEIVQLAAAAAALAAVAALVTGALGNPRVPHDLSRRLAGTASLMRATAALSVGAAAAFAALELLEGRGPFEHVAAVPALIAASFVVLWMARALGDALARAGAFLASLCASALPATVAGPLPTLRFPRVLARAYRSPGPSRGRAPPRPA